MMLGVHFTQDTKENRLMRAGMLLMFGFLQGISMGPLLAVANFYDSGYVSIQQHYICLLKIAWAND